MASIQSHGFPPEHEYLVQGITEDVTTDLSRLPGSFVVGRVDGTLQSGDLADVRMTARALDVYYVVQGSLRKTGGHIAVNMQVVSTETGAHIWAERFRVDLGDIADACDEIAGRLVRTFAVKLIDDVNRRIEAIDPQDWTPDDLVMRGRVNKPHSIANRQGALKNFEQALERDAGSVGAKF